ncbi:MAG: hypothetical protein H7332_12735 [Bdellovibrionales bacterium]|nr:hypothetical protein [Ramlibacter sp.]
MNRTTKWLLWLGIPLAVIGVAAVAVVMLVPSDEELSRMFESRASEALGVPVKIGALHWMVLPLPAVILQDVATQQDKPVTIKRIVAYLQLRPLLHKVVSLQSMEVDGAVVPQLSLKAFTQETGESGKGSSAPMSGVAGGFTLARVPLEHLHFTDLTWISRRGIPVLYEGDIDFDERWRPRLFKARRPGVTPETGLTLTRNGNEDRWAARITVGGGTADGELRIKTDSKKMLHLSGELKPRNIEVQSAVQAFNRRPVVSGRMSGSTVLDADGTNIAGLAQTLHSRTQFTVAPGKVLRFDLHKAIKTFGKEHDGTTPLDRITGVMDTKNTGDGVIWTFDDLKAKSGVLTASGDVVIYNRKIEAKAAVDLVDGLVGVPVKVSGSMDKPDISVPKGAIAGALIGTVILPGIGTAIGARLGALFGGEPKVPGSADRKAPLPAGQRRP